MEQVNHPSHYKTGKYECIEVMHEVFGEEAVKQFCRLNAFKYLWRSDRKNGEEDLKKAKWYLDTLLLWDPEEPRDKYDADDEDDEEDEAVSSFDDCLRQLSDSVKQALHAITDKLSDADKRFETFEEYKSRGFTDRAAFTLALHTVMEDEDEVE